MRVFICVTRKLKWLALLALLRFPLGNPDLHLFSLFWLLIFLDPLFWQSLLQIGGILYARVVRLGRLPSKENYVCKRDYVLPFTGKWTAVNGGVDKKHSHSWGLLSQRYAYDFFIMDDEGATSGGDKKLVQNYFCYGQDVIAPADGEAVKVKDCYADSRTDGRKAYCDANDIRGNFIVIKHADGEYSLIAHLMPGSILVKIGDKVRQGEVVAKCGNSGNTSEPHIHFQLQSGKNFFTSAGLPVAFSDINARAKTNYEKLDKRARPGHPETAGNKSYISRGLEVENGPGKANRVTQIYNPAQTEPALPPSGPRGR